MKVLVTGASGFIGSAVVPALLRAGHSVRCLLRPTSKTDRISGYSWESAMGDVCDADSVMHAMEGCQAVIHLACLSSWDQIDSPLLEAVVEGGTRNILRAAAANANARVVYVSSVLAVNASNQPHVFNEDAAWTIRATNLRYSLMKRRAEALCGEAAVKGLPVVVVNPGEVYGPRDTSFVTAGNLVDFARSNPVLVCKGGTGVVHVDDVAAGIVGALHKGRAGVRYILSGENLTIRALAELTLQILGRKSRILTLPNALIRAVASAGLRLGIPLPFNPRVIPYATQFWFVDSERARHELGIRFRSAREALEPTLAWLVREAYIQ
ncbi:MAG TPA: NAD-dependent epimerase/dehydratase family protein [Bryobacteraceae bacterium]|nr:NAD-dependent epimerase/dehydratase family protein [Bryobacteraceae bacterium]